MQRIVQAPNLMVATLWADMLRRDGLDVSVQRAYAGSIVGEIPPDQALPELWIHDDTQLARARAFVAQLQHPPERRWACPGCSEIIEGPFEQCWNCGTLREEDGPGS
jgi:hypothetical protein